MHRPVAYRAYTVGTHIKLPQPAKSRVVHPGAKNGLSYLYLLPIYGILKTASSGIPISSTIPCMKGLSLLLKSTLNRLNFNEELPHVSAKTYLLMKSPLILTEAYIPNFISHRAHMSIKKGICI
jgi:hypothetical protein